MRDIAKVDDEGFLSFRVNHAQKHRKLALGFSLGHPINERWSTGGSVDLEKFAMHGSAGRNAGALSSPTKCWTFILDMEREYEGEFGHFLPNNIHEEMDEKDAGATGDHGGGGGGGGGGGL